MVKLLRAYGGCLGTKKTKKDAVTSDTPRIGGSNLRPVDLRMGQPGESNVSSLCTEYIGAAE